MWLNTLTCFTIERVVTATWAASARNNSKPPTKRGEWVSTKSWELQHGAPRYLSTDHDPVFEAHRWAVNLRVLEIEEIKTVPLVPMSHPFVERLIGTVRREFLDHVPFWNARDLERKLGEFQVYYNAARSHASLDGYTPLTYARRNSVAPADLNRMHWVSHCRGLVQLPVAA